MSIDAEVNSIVADIERQVKNATVIIDKKQNESIAYDIAGLIVSTPFILKLVGNGINKARQFISKNKNDKSAVAEFLLKLSNKFHHVLSTPLELLASKFVDDPKKQKLFANTVLAGLLLFLAHHSSLEALNFMKNLKVPNVILSGLKTAVKGVELSNVVDEILVIAKDAIGL